MSESELYSEIQMDYELIKDAETSLLIYKWCKSFKFGQAKSRNFWNILFRGLYKKPQDETTQCDEPCLPLSQRRHQRPFNLIDHLIRWRVCTGPAPLATTDHRADGDLTQISHLQGALEHLQGVLGIGFTGKKRSAELLKSFDLLGALVEPLLVDCPPSLDLVMLRVNQGPVLRHAAIGRDQGLKPVALAQRLHRLRLSLI